MIDAECCLCGTMLVLLLAPASARTETDLKVEKLHKQGRIAAAKQDYDGVIAACDEALRLDAKDFESHIGRGHAYLMKRDFARAIADYGEAIRLLSEDPRTYDDRCFVGTLRDYGHALALRRRLSDAYVSRANAYTEKHDFKQAIADVTKAISLGPGDIKLFFLRTFIPAAQKDFGEVITDYGCLVRREPKQADNYVYRGTLYLRLKDYEHAVADFSEAIRLDPRHADAYHCRGTAYLYRMENTRAIADFQKTLRLNPRHFSACFALAHLFASCPQAELRDVWNAWDYARKGCQATEWIGQNCYEIPSRTFAMPIGIDPAIRDNIEKIRVFVSEDHGKTWKHHKDCKPSDKQLRVSAPHDGLYWFTVQTVLKDGDCDPSKLDDLVPAMKVYVNSERRILKSQKTYEELEREVEQLRTTAEQLQKKIEQLESEREPK